MILTATHVSIISEVLDGDDPAPLPVAPEQLEVEPHAECKVAHADVQVGQELRPAECDVRSVITQTDVAAQHSDRVALTQQQQQQQ